MRLWNPDAEPWEALRRAMQVVHDAGPPPTLIGRCPAYVGALSGMGWRLVPGSLLREFEEKLRRVEGNRDGLWRGERYQRNRAIFAEGRIEGLNAENVRLREAARAVVDFRGDRHGGGFAPVVKRLEEVLAGSPGGDERDPGPRYRIEVHEADGGFWARDEGRCAGAFATGESLAQCLVAVAEAIDLCETDDFIAATDDKSSPVSVGDDRPEVQTWMVEAEDCDGEKVEAATATEAAEKWLRGVWPDVESVDLEIGEEVLVTPVGETVRCRLRLVRSSCEFEQVEEAK